MNEVLASAQRKVAEAKAEAVRLGSVAYTVHLTPPEQRALRDWEVAAIIMAPKIRVDQPSEVNETAYAAGVATGMEQAARICEDRAKRYQMAPAPYLKRLQRAADTCAHYIRQAARKAQ